MQMEKIKKSIIFFTLLSLPFLTTAQIYNAQIEAKIALESKGEFMEITGFATNKTESNASLYYEFSVIKNNPNTSNISNNQQDGRFVLEPSQKSTLSKITINAEDKDRIIILLLIYDTNDNIVGKDRIVLNDLEGDELKENNNLIKETILEKNEISEDATHSGADGVFLKGLVVENTKTKPGRDFYRSYTQRYNNDNINGEKIVEINEAIALGNSTRIEVKVENDVIFQFILNPRSDYIEQMVDLAIKQTSIYFQQLRNNRNYVKKY